MKVTLITCTIEIAGRWSVAGIASAHDEVDLPVMRDPRQPGRAHLPGSSLAGSLRRRLGPDLAATWLGPEIGDYEDAQDDDEKRRPQPGQLRILGTRPIEDPISSRGVTAVDRFRGAAKPGALRTEESVEGGSITLLMEHEGIADDAVLDLLAGWRPVVGRSRSTGLGQGFVTEVRSVTLDLADPARDHLTWWLGERTAYLLGEGDAPADADERVRHGDSRSTPTIIPMTVVESIHIGVHDDGSDSRVKATLRLRGGVPYVPGSAWKGVFRHRIAFILDAVGATQAQRDAIVEVLFGGPRMGRGLLTFHDSTLAVARTDTRTHVAIDRFTGGARDGSLFTLESVPRGMPFDLTIDGAAEPLVENLVNHVLRDFGDGLVGVGGSGSRGYGWVCRTDEKPTVEPVHPDELYAAFVPLLPPQPDEEGDPT